MLRTEAGLLRADDWVALAVTLPDDPGRDRQAPSPLLRREFDLPGIITRARLYVTSLGLHEVTLNGRPVTDSLLAPGWTPYHQRLTGEAYDVTESLSQGANVICATLGDGWYRGRLGWDPTNDRCTYGRDVALIAQLEVDLDDGTTHRIVTDASWMASTGEIVSADLYDGSTIDLRLRDVDVHRPGHDTSGWVPAGGRAVRPRVHHAACRAARAAGRGHPGRARHAARWLSPVRRWPEHRGLRPAARAWAPG